jgi:superfamily I DNA and/or RNA helicase
VNEVNAAVRALELVRANNGASPSLAVLSPYREQVNLLRDAISKEIDGRLAHLSSFQRAIDQREWCGTVDSFQGGEADLVIVSLVRNNAHTSPARALGFLRDNRRMNVLLSRAKWQMVLIGSLAFYRHVAEMASLLSGTDIGFLRDLLDALNEGEDKKEVRILPLEQLRGAHS